jgi:hypothetical protein
MYDHGRKADRIRTLADEQLDGVDSLMRSRIEPIAAHIQTRPHKFHLQHCRIDIEGGLSLTQPSGAPGQCLA